MPARRAGCRRYGSASPSTRVSAGRQPAAFLSRRPSDSTTLVFIAALALTHLLARPHVLALPVMVARVGGMISAADRSRRR
jgi:hypothetical protein